MKLTTCLLFTLALALAFAVGAGAQSNVRWDADGTKTLTQDGWTLAGPESSQLRDFSSGQADAGTNGVWAINENDSGANMEMYKDPGGISATQGMVIARVKYISSSGSPKGTFGYSSAAGNHSVLICVRSGVLNFKTAEEGTCDVNGGGTVTVPGGTSTYRVYALSYTSGGVFNVWVSNGSDWSASQSNWTQLVTNGTWSQGQSPLIDGYGAAQTGVLMGSFSSRAENWQGNVDYISWSSYSGEQLPWNFSPVIAPPDDSQYVSDTIPTVMEPSQQYNVSVTLRNTGSNTWTQAAGYSLGAVGDSDPFCAFNRVDLAGGDSIPQTQTKTFNFTMTAPASVGTYTTDWRMVHSGVWFGYTLTKQVIVSLPDSAQYISDTIPANMDGGQQYSVSVTMKNTSQNTWTQAGGYKLGGVDNSDPFYPSARVELGGLDSIGPGQQKAFTFTMTAPVSGGTYTTDWRMVRENVCWFGDVLTEQVEVEGGLNIVLQDTLQGSTSGTMSGGQFVSGGWQTTGTHDYIFWHLPYPLSCGAVDFYVKGLIPRDPTEQYHCDSNIFEMYDYTYLSADTNYTGFRDNPYKVRLNKLGTDYDYVGLTDACQIVWIFPPDDPEVEWDTAVLNWNPATNYHFRLEWGPPNAGYTTCRILRDGVTIWQRTLLGSYSPAGHSVRLGWSTRDTDWCPRNATFSNFTVYDLTPNTPPAAPTVTSPSNGATVNTLTPWIFWSGDAHTSYRVRVCTSNDPNTGIAWDSGDVTSTASQATTGSLTNLTNYYVFVKLGNSYGWSGWSAAGHWFRVDTSYVGLRTGVVRLTGYCAEDDGGKFLGLGFSYMQALRRCKYDRNRFRSDLAFMSSNGFLYMRALSMVGWYEAWAGKEIAPVSFYNRVGTYVPAWSDYWQQLRDMIDIAYDEFGIRTELTIFADAQLMPNKTDRINHMQTILNNLVGREHKIMHLEVCNEAWQNGFPEPGGEADLREFGAYLRDRSAFLVALSSNNAEVPDMERLYCGSAANLCTYHFSRDIGTSEGGWLPVRDCWKVYLSSCLPPTSSNEPIGPGSSVSSENDPIKLVSAACFAWIAKLPMYVYHTEAGVFGITRFEDAAGVSNYQYLAGILPPDLPNWTRNDGIESAAPFSVYCMGQENKYWTDIGGATNGCHRSIGSKSGYNFVCYPQGILSGGLTLRARQQLEFTVYNPLTGAVALGPVMKYTNDQFTLPQGPGAYIIKGVTGGWDITPPGPVTDFDVEPGDAQNTLTWVNPTDSDFTGTKILCKTSLPYPSGPDDLTATVIYDAPGTNYVDSGLTNGQIYYYSAFAHDVIPNYSTGLNGSGTPVHVDPPGPVTSFKTYGGNQQIDLAWTNPTDPSPTGIRILCKAGSGYPMSPTDPSATVVYDALGTNYSHTGLTNGTKYYYAAYAYTAPTSFSTAAQSATYAAAEVTIPTMKGLANSVIRSVKGNVVTAVFTGYFYMQDRLNPYGLKVSTTETPLPSIGQKVDVLGYMTGMAGNERSLSCTGNWIRVTDPGPITIVPAALNNKAVGGANLNSNTPGVVGGTGANNVGLLVRVSGKVTQSGSGYFYVDDGCGLKDGTKTSTIDNVGVRIKVSAPSGVVAGKYVVVTGIVSPFSSTGPRPQVLPLPQPAGVQVVGP